MPLPNRGTITLEDIDSEFGNGASLFQNYSGNLTSTQHDDHPNIPASGEIALQDFYTIKAPISGPGLFNTNHNMVHSVPGTAGSFTDASGASQTINNYTGWEVYLGRFVSGTSTIPGINFPIPSDPTPNPMGSYSASGGDTNVPSTAGNYSVSFATPDTIISGQVQYGNEIYSGKNAMQLELASVVTQTGFDIVRGPLLVSKDRRQITAGEKVRFVYRAVAGNDAFDVLGIIMDDTGSSLVHQFVLDATQSSSGGATDWITVTTTVTTSGSYYFVFINGTFDYSGGRAAGASLYVTDVEVLAGGSLTENGGFSNVGNNPNWTSNTTTSAVTFTTSGNGIDAVLNIQTVGTQAIIRVIDGGSGFAVGDSITVGGQQLGGNASGDDLTFNVAALA